MKYKVYKADGTFVIIESVTMNGALALAMEDFAPIRIRKLEEEKKDEKRT